MKKQWQEKAANEKDIMQAPEQPGGHADSALCAGDKVPTPLSCGGEDGEKPPALRQYHASIQFEVMGIHVNTGMGLMLGRGTFGTVYRATIKAIGSYVALKVYHDQSDTDTINREAQVYRWLESLQLHIPPFARLALAPELGMRVLAIEMFDSDMCRHKPVDAGEMVAVVSGVAMFSVSCV